MEISIRIPASAQQRYLRGGCFVFANELRRYVRRETGRTMQLHALWVDGRPEHAFLVDSESATAYDARGRFEIDAGRISEGALYQGVCEMGPITVGQMREWARSMDGHNARLDIDRYVSIMEE